MNIFRRRWWPFWHIWEDILEGRHVYKFQVSKPWNRTRHKITLSWTINTVIGTEPSNTIGDRNRIIGGNVENIKTRVPKVEVSHRVRLNVCDMTTTSEFDHATSSDSSRTLCAVYILKRCDANFDAAIYFCAKATFLFQVRTLWFAYLNDARALASNGRSKRLLRVYVYMFHVISCSRYFPIAITIKHAMAAHIPIVVFIIVPLPANNLGMFINTLNPIFRRVLYWVSFLATWIYVTQLFYSHLKSWGRRRRWDRHKNVLFLQ